MATPIATATAPRAPGRLGAPLDAAGGAALPRRARHLARPAAGRARPAGRGGPGQPRPRRVHRRHPAVDGAVEGRRRPARPAPAPPGTPAGSASRERERLATLVWGRLDTSLDPRLAGAATSNGVPGSGSALAVSLPEACRLSDALAASLRVRLSVDPADADVTARVRSLRAQVERIRDLVAAEPAGERPRRGPTGCCAGSTAGSPTSPRGRSAAPTSAACSGRWRARPRWPSATSSSGAAHRREDAQDEARARALRTELEARGAALRDLAARCVAAVQPAPRFAVPEVAALGPVPAGAGRRSTPTWPGSRPSAGR